SSAWRPSSPFPSRKPRRHANLDDLGRLLQRDRGGAGPKRPDRRPRPHHKKVSSRRSAAPIRSSARTASLRFAPFRDHLASQFIPTGLACPPSLTSSPGLAAGEGGTLIQ